MKIFNRSNSIIVLMWLVLYIRDINGMNFNTKDNENSASANRLKTLKPRINEASLLEAANFGADQEMLKFLENNLEDILILDGSIFHAEYLESFPDNKAKYINTVARKLIRASDILSNKECMPFGFNGQECAECISQIKLPNSKLKMECLEALEKYQIDNFYPFRRLLPANYSDGFIDMKTDDSMPIPTAVFANAFKEESGNEFNSDEFGRNIMMVQWTQFIEHDLSKIGVMTMVNGSPIKCCSSDFHKLAPRSTHPSCAPIKGLLPENPYGWTECYNYVRSALAVSPDCSFGPANQLNQASMKLDLSQLYGYSKELQNKLRSFRNGELKVFCLEKENLECTSSLLPLADKEKSNFCALSSNSLEQCLMSGDNRVNCNPLTSSIYTIFLRNHNNFAKKIKQQNPSWDDEQIFRAAKARNIYIYRKIIYNDLLPVIIGKSEANKIFAQSSTDDKIEEGISNEFATAGIRFYFSMLPNKVWAKNDHGNKEELFDLRDNFYKSTAILNTNFDEIIAATLSQPALKMDPKYSISATKYFRQNVSAGNENYAINMLSFDIQRGRDHGLAPYVEYLKISTDSDPKGWNDLENFINTNNVNKLKKIYHDINDVELIVGGILENPLEDSLLGPTLTYIIREQFFNLYSYDSISRHFEGGIFEGVDISDLNLFTGHTLICETTNVSSIPENIFLTPSFRNSFKPCKGRRNESK